MRNRIPMALCAAMLLSVSIAGCKKDSAPNTDDANEPAAVEPTTAEPAYVATEAEIADAAAASAAADAATASTEPDKASFIAPLPASFDPKTFAGGYGADGSASLAITADGHFSLTVDEKTIDGTWEVDPDGATITLDPSNKDEPDRLLEVLPDGSVKLIGGPTLPRATNAR